MITLNVVDPWALALSSQTKDYKIGKNAALRSKNKNWSSQNNISEWNDISIHILLFQWTTFCSTLKIQLRVLVFSFFVSKCVSCCSCLNSLHITCYSLCFLFKNSMNRMFLSPICHECCFSCNIIEYFGLCSFTWESLRQIFWN